MWDQINDLVSKYRYEQTIDFKLFDDAFKIICLESFLKLELNKIWTSKDAEAFESFINICAIYNLNEKFINDLIPFLLESWHKQHESLSAIIQEYRVTEIITLIDQIVDKPIDYLNESETDWYGYIRRLFFALGDINSIESIAKLVNFTSNKDEMIAKWANEQLNRINKSYS